MIPADPDELRQLRREAESGVRRINVRPSGWLWVVDDPPPDDDQGGDCRVFDRASAGAGR